MKEKSSTDSASDSASSLIPHPFPKRRFGQNFLTDRNVVDRIIAAVQPQPDETIIEIGPGRGALTRRLVQSGARVVAIEFDRELAPQLHDEFSGQSNFRLVEADALEVDFCAAVQPAPSARVVANLPYNVGTAILQRLIEQRTCISEMTIMLQREVADRITAAADTADRGYLSVFVEAYCEAEKLFDVTPQAFRPVPKVFSTVVRLRVRERIAADVKDEDLLWQVVSAGFAHPRKTILNNLREAPAKIQELLKKRGGASIVLCDAAIPALRRAETLALEEWAILANAILEGN
ncbi:MAG TPA: 16S rRNA (adenine(1518)-N(6)/adenine(1519)-N(6))-dimethyltransferase RsmA [Pyrinomonadaceae bacterium]|nr:16S rRNA (adenine(1518)-N(6)/adenine(1519)-N(6))-dimethyltransferase RsmA [Pyrinomonadaceae bacterium]